MSKIAIKGHATRGNEVIALLEMLGGVDWHGFAGNRLDSAYYISKSRAILFDDTYDIVFEDGIKEFIVFTIEEFEQKFPYKVGDKVKNIYGAYGKVDEMKWIDDEIQYRLDFGHHTSGWYSVCELQPYKLETNMKINKCIQCVYAVNNNHCGLRGFRSNFNVNYCSAQNVDKLPNGFELQEDGYFSWVNKNPKYPKTFEECCAVLDCKADHFFTDFSYEGCDIEISDYEDKIDDLLQNFRKLRYCRDAYWKIAGEQMGLNEPWEPDWKDDSDKYFICYLKDELWMSNIRDCNRLLVFPTEEMRDAFYENFKDLIECCKELL